MELRDILEAVHEAGYVLMVFEPIVRAITTRKLCFQAADFRNAVAAYSAVAVDIDVRGRYVSPEVAKAMLVLARSSEGFSLIIATAAIDVFAFGLYLWEYYKHHSGCKSLWACLGVDAMDDWAVFECAASLTDEQVQHCIEANFLGTDAFVRFLLLDCLRVDPLQRASAKKLKEFSLLSLTSTPTTFNKLTLASTVLPALRAAMYSTPHLQNTDSTIDSFSAAIVRTSETNRRENTDALSISPPNNSLGITASIQVSYLSYNVTESVTRRMIKNLLSTYGNVVNVVMKKQISGDSFQSGYGFVYFDGPDAVTSAITATKELFNVQVDDVHITCRISNSLEAYLLDQERL